MHRILLATDTIPSANLQKANTEAAAPKGAALCRHKVGPSGVMSSVYCSCRPLARRGPVCMLLQVPATKSLAAPCSFPSASAPSRCVRRAVFCSHGLVVPAPSEVFASANLPRLDDCETDCRERLLCWRRTQLHALHWLEEDAPFTGGLQWAFHSPLGFVCQEFLQHWFPVRAGRGCSCG